MTVKDTMTKTTVYTPDEVAAQLKLHPVSIRLAIRQGRIRALRFGNRWRVTEAEIQRLLRDGMPAV